MPASYRSRVFVRNGDGKYLLVRQKGGRYGLPWESVMGEDGIPGSDEAYLSAAYRALKSVGAEARIIGKARVPDHPNTRYFLAEFAKWTNRQTREKQWVSTEKMTRTQSWLASYIPTIAGALRLG